MATQQAALLAVVAKVAAVTGIKQAPNYPTEKIGIFPYAAVYPGSGTHAGGTASGSGNYVGERLSLYDIIVEIHIARKDLPHDLQAAYPFADSVPDALLKDPTLSGTVDTIGEIEQMFGALGWGGGGGSDGGDTIGYRFTIHDVKQKVTIA